MHGPGPRILVKRRPVRIIHQCDTVGGAVRQQQPRHSAEQTKPLNKKTPHREALRGVIFREERDRALRGSFSLTVISGKRRFDTLTTFFNMIRALSRRIQQGKDQ